MLAVHTSVIEPLPHQITAVYEVMLQRQPLRFLLADDPGAGKTIMAGLLIKELIARGDLILAGGNTKEIIEKALRDGYLRVVTLYRNERAAQPEALFKAAKCFEDLGQTQRADHFRSRLKDEFGSSEWAKK